MNISRYAKQWVVFYSGQGPYYGQAAWFMMFDSKRVPSAQERYKNEIKRVTSVLDKHFDDKNLLVGNRISYADISSNPCQMSIPIPGLMESSCPGANLSQRRCVGGQGHRKPRYRERCQHQPVHDTRGPKKKEQMASTSHLTLCSLMYGGQLAAVHRCTGWKLAFEERCVSEL
jgi:hypothetical protein